MKKQFLFCAFLLSSLSMMAKDYVVKSPDGKLVVTVSDDNQKMSYRVDFDNKKILLPSSLGLKTDIEDFTVMEKVEDSETRQIEKNYQMRQSKKQNIHYLANQLRLKVVGNKEHYYYLTFQVSDNNVAYRYELPQQNNGNTKIVKVYSEASSFRMPDKTTTFLCPQITPGTGWMRSKPSYEEEYTADAPMNKKSQFGVGYTFPCLFNLTPTLPQGKKGATEQLWALISETGVTSNYCGSRLSDFDSQNGYTIAFPQEGENNGVGSTCPAFGLPGATPWRTITVGSSLKPIVETTIPFDVVDPLYEASEDYKAGRYTWSWLIWQDNSMNYNDQVTFIDLASKLGLEYILVDALWDGVLGHEGLAKLASYAKSKNVRLLVWYNSNGVANDAPQGPRDVMSNSIARKKEMRWLNSIGVAGIKVDFFGGDKQETMKLYEDILSDANDNGIQVIFHGCTLPRGWERMYPNYAASEAALASENVFFSDHHAKMEGFQLCMHPFSRNAVGSFDWGGIIMNKYMSKDNKSRHQRFTTDAFEFATAITNQTSVNCEAVTPQAMKQIEDNQFGYKKEMLEKVPTLWQDTKFIAGYPTKYVVIARQEAKSGKWYIGGINGSDKPVKLTLDIPMAQTMKNPYIYFDNRKKTNAIDETGIYTQLSSAKDKNMKYKKGKLTITLQPMGGMVIFDK